MALLALLAGTYKVQAQSCCCTSTGANWSILPNLERHVIGVRYNYKSFYSVYPQSLNPELSGKRTDQVLHSTELFGRFYVAKPLQLSVQLPVNVIQEKTEKGISTEAGLGDMSFLLQYSVLDPHRCNGHVSKHQLRLGTGIKLPSGRFKMDPATNMFLSNLQLGTGSVDFMFNAIYTYRYKNFGFNVLGAYKLNTANPQQYKFGDRLQSGATAFYVVTVKDVQLMPNAGINFEHGFYNRMRKQVLDYTGGDFLTTTVGLDLYYKQFAFSSSFTPALMNELNWGGEVRRKYSFEAGFFYNFSSQIHKPKTN